MATPLVLLHGFAGTRRSWDPVVARLPPGSYEPVALDLRGHGERAADRPITFAACVQDVLAAVDGPFALAGYSLGGRVALHVALAAPGRVTRLTLIATTAGVDDPAARRAGDEALAARTERGDIAAFAQDWTAQPLFAGTPPAAAALWREDVLRNDPRALAAALRGIGSGAMAPLWDRLGALTMPVTVVVGERDARYRAIGDRLVAALPAARLVLVPGAGHGLPREAPDAVAAALV